MNLEQNQIIKATSEKGGKGQLKHQLVNRKNKNRTFLSLHCRGHCIEDGVQERVYLVVNIPTRGTYKCSKVRVLMSLQSCGSLEVFLAACPYDNLGQFFKYANYDHKLPKNSFSSTL